MATEKMTGRDILLALLYAPGVTGKANEPIRGRTRLMKLLFIFNQELYRKFKFDEHVSPDDLPQFGPWRYGPFSREVFDTMEFFTRIGFVELMDAGEEEPAAESAEEYGRWLDDTALDEEDQSQLTEFSEQTFRLSQKGVMFVETELWPALSTNQQSMLSEYKARFNSSPLYAILNYVYRKYPDMTARSEIRDRYLH